MYKALCVAVLLLPTFVLSQESDGAKSLTAGLPTPVIVAKAKLTNQSAQITQTNIATAKETGLYRLSIYGAITGASPNSQSGWQVNLFWTDDSGVQQSSPDVLSGQDYKVGQFWNLNDTGQSNFSAGFVGVVEAVAGTPIMYSVTLDGAPDGSVYSLYYTLERLE
jgi:hypothetical protein